MSGPIRRLRLTFKKDESLRLQHAGEEANVRFERCNGQTQVVIEAPDSFRIDKFRGGKSAELVPGAVVVMDTPKGPVRMVYRGLDRAGTASFGFADSMVRIMRSEVLERGAG